MKAPEHYDAPKTELSFPTLPIQARMAVANLAAYFAFLTYAAVSPHKASVRRLKDMPFTLFGYGAITFAAFHWTHGFGWLVAGLLLVALEAHISDRGASA